MQTDPTDPLPPSSQWQGDGGGLDASDTLTVTARTLDLTPWAGRWVAVDNAGIVRCDAPSLTELLDIVANGQIGEVEVMRAPADDDPVERNEVMVLRLAGSTSQVALYDMTLEARPPLGLRDAKPMTWRGIVAVFDPWRHQGTAVILGQSGFLDAFTVTFGPDGFVVEPASAFRQRFPLALRHCPRPSRRTNGSRSLSVRPAHHHWKVARVRQWARLLSGDGVSNTGSKPVPSTNVGGQSDLPTGGHLDVPVDGHLNAERGRLWTPPGRPDRYLWDGDPVDSSGRSRACRTTIRGTRGCW